MPIRGHFKADSPRKSNQIIIKSIFEEQQQRLQQSSFFQNLELEISKLNNI